MYFEIAIVLVLTVLNGLLAMSELAIVSARAVRLRAMADSGTRGAATALALAADPGRFLSTVQIGITLVGVLSGAFSGATLGARLSATLLAGGMSASTADLLGVGIVVVVITYLSLIIGELVPKQIALANPERVAVRMAPAMKLLSQVALPLVWLLDRSGKLVLALIGQSGARASEVTDEEIRLLIAEAEGAGVIHRAETEMIAGVMRIADRTARGLMTPRREIEMADASATRAEVLARFRTTGRSRLPIRDGGVDDIIGVLNVRDFIQAENGRFDLRAITRPAPVVRDAMPAIQVIEELKSAPGHTLLVYDEYGHFEGLITPMDLLGAITGGFDEDEEDEPKFVTRNDGSFLVAGWMAADEFADRLGLTLKDGDEYETVAGLVLDLAKELPKVGQTVQIGDWLIEVVDMDGRRIDKLLVQRAPRAG